MWKSGHQGYWPKPDALAFLGNNSKETLLKWAICGPEFISLEEEFETARNGSIVSTVGKHHQDSPTFQLTFLHNIRKVVNAIEGVFNPFGSDAATMTSLRNGLQISRSDEIGDSICSLKRLGQSQLADFVKERFLAPSESRYAEY